jgi:hypothetical protein
MIEDMDRRDAFHTIVTDASLEPTQNRLPWILCADCTRGIRSFTQLLTKRAVNNAGCRRKGHHFLLSRWSGSFASDLKGF